MRAGLFDGIDLRGRQGRCRPPSPLDLHRHRRRTRTASDVSQEWQVRRARLPTQEQRRNSLEAAPLLKNIERANRLQSLGRRCISDPRRRCGQRCNSRREPRPHPAKETSEILNTEHVPAPAAKLEELPPQGQTSRIGLHCVRGRVGLPQNSRYDSISLDGSRSAPRTVQVGSSPSNRMLCTLITRLLCQAHSPPGRLADLAATRKTAATSKTRTR